MTYVSSARETLEQAVVAAPIYAAHLALARYVHSDDRFAGVSIGSFNPGSGLDLADDELAVLKAHEAKPGYCGFKTDETSVVGPLLGHRTLSLLRIELPAEDEHFLRLQYPEDDAAYAAAAWKCRTRMLRLETDDPETARPLELAVFIDQAYSTAAASADDIDRAIRRCKAATDMDVRWGIRGAELLREMYGETALPWYELTDAESWRLADAVNNAEPEVIDTRTIGTYLPKLRTKPSGGFVSPPKPV